MADSSNRTKSTVCQLLKQQSILYAHISVLFRVLRQELYMFSILKDDLNTLGDKAHLLQAEQSIVIPSVEKYLPNSLSVSLML